MAELSPAQRSLHQRIGAYKSWANTADPTARTQPGRDKFMARFERAVDPEGVLPDAERRRRAEAAKRAYFLELSLKSARARRKADAA